MGSVTRERLRFATSLITSPESRKGYERLRAARAEISRLQSAPRHVAQTTTLLDPPMRLADGPTFAAQYTEIFLRGIYDFPRGDGIPTIVDGGANVGAAIRYWKDLYPDARIVAFEPDPAVFAVLQHNTQHLNGIELRRSALSAPGLGDHFVFEGTDAGRLTAGAGEREHGQVATVPLSTVLKELGHVALLKLDIEGAETAVLQESESELGRVDRIFVEYHSFEGERQTLADLLFLVRRAGFRIHMHNDIPAGRPFHGVPSLMGMDFQANIFAWRPGGHLPVRLP